MCLRRHSPSPAPSDVGLVTRKEETEDPEEEIPHFEKRFAVSREMLGTLQNYGFLVPAFTPREFLRPIFRLGNILFTLRFLYRPV